MTIKIGNKDIFGNFKVTIDDVTFEEFLEFAEEDITCELLNGVLVINSPASYKHQAISRFLLTYFDLVGLESGTGRSLSAPFIIKLAGEWAPEPDVFFFLNDKKDRVKKAFFEGIPDIIVEILSPKTRDDDLNIKVPKYLQQGVPEIWIIDPDVHELVIHQPGKRKQVFNARDSLVTSPTIPTIRLRLKWIFEEDVNPLKCLQEIGILKK